MASPFLDICDFPVKCHGRHINTQRVAHVATPTVKKACRTATSLFFYLISTMVCFMMVKRMTYTSHPRKAAKQPLRKVVASVVVNAYTQ